jgi:hypothetical protein
MADTKYIVGIEFQVGDLDSKLSSKIGPWTGGRAQGAKIPVDAEGRVGAITGKLEALSQSAKAAVGRVTEAFTGAVEKAGELALTFGTIGAGARWAPPSTASRASTARSRRPRSASPTSSRPTASPRTSTRAWARPRR